MKVGDLVKWRHPDESDIGVVSRVTLLSAKVMWSDGAYDWHELADLEVLNENG